MAGLTGGSVAVLLSVPLLLLLPCPSHGETLLTRRALLVPGHLQLTWSPAREHLVLRVEARTLGYVALSFGSVHAGGGPPGAQDALLAWTSEAEVLLQDGVVRRDGRIAADRVNDYELLEGSRNDSHFLSVTLQRRWSTCDDLEDFPLGAGSVLVSWALYPRPPEQLELFPRLEEGERHGSTVLVFNAPPQTLAPNAGLHVWPLLVPQVRLPSNSSTLRWCTMFQTPEIRSRHWIIGYRSEVRRTDAVRQIRVLECGAAAATGPLVPGLAGRPCTEPWSVPSSCQRTVLLWTPGNDMTIFPGDIGIPIGSKYGASDYYMLQVLYSLADSGNEVSDNSGLQVLLSGSRPRHEAALMQVGLRVRPVTVLPPRQPAVTIRASCSATCLQQALPHTGVTIVSVHLVAHAAARKLILRHLQDQNELTPIAMELGYQPDQQGVRLLDPRVQILTEDNLILECQYNTQDRDRATLGGFGPEDEICEAYLLYFPRISLSSCLSQSRNDILNILGIKPLNSKHGEITEVYFLGKEMPLSEALYSVDWGFKNSTQIIDQLQLELSQKGTMQYCMDIFGEQVQADHFERDEIVAELVPMNQVTRCGVWDEALRHERQRNVAPSRSMVHSRVTWIIVTTIISFLFLQSLSI